MPVSFSPVTREEAYLAKTAGQDVTIPAPVTREELYLAAMAGENVTLPEEPLSRIEQYLEYIVEHGGGGGDITLETLNVSENGTTNAPSGKAYNKVVANVQPTGTKQINANGTHDVSAYASAEVSVPVPTLDTLTATDNGTFTPQSGHAYSSVVVAIPTASGVSF